MSFILPYQQIMKPRLGMRPDYGHPSLKGLVGWWLMNEGAGETVYDSAGRKDGTLTAMEPETDWIVGRNGVALKFNGTGSGDYVSVGVIDVTAFKSITWSCWIKTVSTSGDRIFSLRHSGGDDIRTWISGADNHVAVDDGTAYSAVFGNGFKDGTWHLITGTFDGSSVRCYADGILQSTTGSASFNFATCDGTLTLARSSNASSSFYDGSIDDVRIYDRELSQGEIMDDLFLQPYGAFDRKIVIPVPVAAAGGVAPTSVLYGSLVGSLGGPV